MLENILNLEDKFDLYVFDVFGVIWDGKKVIANSREVMRKLKDDGKKVMILSNGTVLGAKMAESYAKRGFVAGIHYDQLVTSGDVAYEDFCRDKIQKKYYQFARPNPDLFAESVYVQVTDPQEADFIYAGVPQTWEGDYWKDHLDLEAFMPELQKLVATGKPLICVNPDMRAFENQYDEAVVRQGSVAKAYVELGGRVEFYGKPCKNIYDFALRAENMPRHRMLMIGDTLETDILGGKNAGMKTALTQTGIASLKMREAKMDDLAQYAAQLGIVPDYII